MVGTASVVAAFVLAMRLICLQYACPLVSVALVGLSGCHGATILIVAVVVLAACLRVWRGKRPLISCM